MDIYTTTMHDDEKVLSYANKGRHKASFLKHMGVFTAHSEIAMVILNALLEQYDYILKYQGKISKR